MVSIRSPNRVWLHVGFVALAVTLTPRPATADNTVQALHDAWIAQSDSDPCQAASNFETNVNPSTQLRRW